MKTKLAVALAVAWVFFISTLFAQDTPVLPMPRSPEDVSKALRIHYVAPTYPADAMAECVEGEVVLRLIVSDTGAISRVSVLSGPTVLADSAIAAAKKWMYEPYILDGKPVRYKTQATEKFRAPGGQCPHHSTI